MENEDILENDAFDDALKSLDEQLEEHHQEIEAYDETEQEAIMYEEGVEYTPELDAENNPEAVSYAEQAEETGAFESHESDASEILVEEEEDAFAEYPTFEDSETDLDNADVGDDTEHSMDEDGGTDAAYEDSMDEAVDDTVDEEMTEPGVSEDAAPAEETSASDTHGEADDFNLATLNQLVGEIRQESQRVTEMKDAVAEALQLIQEMSESLKS